MNIIEVKDLSYSYTDWGTNSFALDKINLSIAPGELVAIQGPSGSGKSTLLYLLGLLATPSKGEFWIKSQNSLEMKSSQLARMRNKNIGFVFQQFHLLPKTNILNNILLPTQYNSPDDPLVDYEAKAFELVKRMGLEKNMYHLPNQLSGGQQQRVAICRALINDPDLLLADEPTGNLDTHSARNIIDILKTLQRDQNKTVVIITHDSDIASQCERIIYIKDGHIVNDGKASSYFINKNDEKKGDGVSSSRVEEKNFYGMDQRIKHPLKWEDNWMQDFDPHNFRSTLKQSLSLSIGNLNRNRIRSSLTMLGVSVGIAAVFSMITLGQYTKEKILAGYADLGVNTMSFMGYPKMSQKATEVISTPFNTFEWNRDIYPMFRLFPEISKISPIMNSWQSNVSFGGKSIENVRTIGTDENGLDLNNRKILYGRNLSHYDVEKSLNVCVIGLEIAQKLYSLVNPLGQILKINQNDYSFGCRIVGVLKSATSNKDYIKPNLNVFIPYTYYKTVTLNTFGSGFNQILIKIRIGSDVSVFSQKVMNYFKLKYGSSGEFWAGTDSVLVAQMRKFLTLFTLLLSTVAFVTLLVGGIGITNMMIVSVSDRFREIGLRKAIGASDLVIKVQLLLESVLVCGIAGVIGLALGFSVYQIAIWGATKLISNLRFEWVMNPVAFGLSFVSIFLVGILSGIYPAKKAEKLQVIEALRSE